MPPLLSCGQFIKESVKVNARSSYLVICASQKYEAVLSNQAMA